LCETEEGLAFAPDQRVDWALVPMDQDWLDGLFAGRRAVSLQLDTYAAAVRNLSDSSAWTLPSGRVARIDQISVHYHPSGDPAESGAVARSWGAMQHGVLGLKKPRAHQGELVGWIVRIRELAS
jgi:hypothetical protein